MGTGRQFSAAGAFFIRVKKPCTVDVHLRDEQPSTDTILMADIREAVQDKYAP